MHIKMLKICILLFSLLIDSLFIQAIDTPAEDNTLRLQQIEEELNRIKELYQKEGHVSVLEKNIDLFLPKYDFRRPEKYQKESYSKIYRYLSDSKKRTENPKDVDILPEELIEEYENFHKKELLDMIIKKEVNMEDVKYGPNLEFYGFPDANYFENAAPKLLDTEKLNIIIKNFQEIAEFILFEPKQLVLNDKPICIPTMTILNVKNIMNENLILRSIKSDLFQVTIFYFRPGKEPTQSYNQKSLYPKTLQPGESISFQIIILPDTVGAIKGNIYLEFNDSKVVIFPLVINAIENIYRVNPIYFPSWLGSKLLTTPVMIYNPHPRTLIIKEVINSFSSINLVWPNGQPVSNNSTSISTSMLEVPPKSTKNLMYVNYYKEVPGVEYGLLQLKTDKDTLIIPVLVRVEIQGIKTFPSYYNFGVVDLNSNIKRMIPISISNASKQPLQIKAIYTTYEEILLEFIINSTNDVCNPIFQNSPQLENIPKDSDFFPNTCVLSPGDSHLLGYVTFDPTNYVPEVNDPHLYKKIKGTIFLETNFTNNPLTELIYEYYLDKGTFLNENQNQNQNSNSLQWELFLNSTLNKQSVKYEISTKIKSPFNSGVLRNFNDTSSVSAVANIFNDNSQLSLNLKNPIAITNDNTLTIDVIIRDPALFVNKKYFFFHLKTSHNLFTVLPIKFYDGMLELNYCDNTLKFKDCLNENYSVFKNLNAQNQVTTLNVEFGLLSTSETAKKYFSILNDNKETISAIDVETNQSSISLGIESFEDIYTNEKVTLTNSKFTQAWDNGRLQRALKKKVVNKEKEKIQINFVPGTYTLFSINVSSHGEQDVTGYLTLFFSENSKLVINVSTKFLKGNLNITPSIIRFEPAFPGLFQSKLVSSKSSYNIPINIHSIKSMDQRIIPILLTNSIISNNRTEIVKIIFDPSKVQIEENFMRGEYNLANSTAPKHAYLTYKELYLWKEKQKLWELLGSQGRTEINTSVKIKTNIQSETVNVRAFLTKPSLVKKDEVDFGLVQIGETINRYIEGFNPSDESMTIQVLLASEEFYDIHNNSMFTTNRKFRFTPASQITLMECQFYNSTASDLFSGNITLNLLAKLQKKKKKTFEGKDDFYSNIDYSNSILIEEDIYPQSLINKTFPKQELLKKLFLYANNRIKSAFISTERILCNTNFIMKNEIVLNNYKELTERIFSDEFNKEIGIVKKMTECSPLNSNKTVKETKIGVFEQLAHFLKVFFKMEAPIKKKKEEAGKQQDFFLPKIVSSQTYQVKPHQKFKIGPIIYHPTNFTNNSATLLIKNNLTILYPIKLKGTGGSGIVNFYLVEREQESLTAIRETHLEENRLIIDIDSATYSKDPSSEYITKTIKLKNIGTLPVKFTNISIEHSGCDVFGININNCDSIFLKPDESYRLQLTIKPDFNFYLMEKDIVFESQYQTVILKINININSDLLAMKNRLFNFDYLKNYGFISVFVVVFIVFVIAYILSKEYSEIQDARSDKKNQTTQKLQFFSAKELIDNDPSLKFQNLFIKSYRRFNQSFYDDFINKQIDKPGSYDIEGLGEKKRSTGTKVVQIPHKRSEEFPEPVIEPKKEEIAEPQNNNEIKANIPPEAIKEVTVVKSKLTTQKKITEAKTKKEKKTIVRKPVGLAKKEEIDQASPVATKVNDPKKGIHTDTSTNPNKYDVYNAMNNSQGTYSKLIPTEYSQPGYENYYYEPPQGQAAYSSIYNVEYWPKNYYYNNQAKFQQASRYDYGQQRYGGGNYVQQNKGAATEYQNYHMSQSSSSGINRTQQEAGKSSEYFNKEETFSDSKSTPANAVTQTKSENNTNTNTTTSTSIANNREKLTRENNLPTESIPPQATCSINQEKTENPAATVTTNLLEQFKSFAPIMSREGNTSTSQATNKPEQVKQNQEKNQCPPQTKSQSLDDKQGGNADISSFKNYDLPNIFTKQNAHKDTPQDNLSENEDKEEISEHNYQSEKEIKPVEDSGTEEFKFNFNAIFGPNNMKLPMNFNNDFTDNEEQKDSNKPYFIINPFAITPGKTVLDELIDDDNDKEDNDDLETNKIDEVAEGEDEGDEEDPLWNSENVDIKKEGFFDETGTYKLKQMDFNFDFDFKSKK